MSTLHENKNSVLDTFKINSSGIFLKDFHILRTQEAFLSVGVKAPIDKIKASYDLVEKENLTETCKMGRLIFQIPTAESSFKILEIAPMKSVLKLQPILKVKQPSGTGSKNFKWLERDFWDQINSLKAITADDVLTINEKMQVVETSRFNLFFYDPAEKVVMTPTLSSGCIHGVYRRWALGNKFITLPNNGPVSIFEKDILFSEIHRYQIFVANSVREVLSVELFSV